MALKTSSLRTVNELCLLRIETSHSRNENPGGRTSGVGRVKSGDLELSTSGEDTGVARGLDKSYAGTRPFPAICVSRKQPFDGVKRVRHCWITSSARSGSDFQKKGPRFREPSALV